MDKLKWLFKAQNMLNHMQYVYQSVFELWLPNLLINFRCVFLAVMFVASLPGMFVLFVRPSLQLTQTAACVQLFGASNPLEAYDHRFSEFTSTSSGAESTNTGIYPYQSDMIPRMRVSFVFGVLTRPLRGPHSWLPVVQDDDNDGGELDFDKENFDFYDQRSQLWFLSFCKALKKEFKPKKLPSESEEQPNSKSEESEDLLETEEDWENLSTSNLCLIDLLKIVFTRRCSSDPNDMVDSVCCDQAFPFDSNVLQLCLRNSTFLERYVLPYQSILSEKLYFNKTNGVVLAVEIQQSTPHKWTSSYKAMEHIYSQLAQFFKKQIEHKYVDLGHLDKSELRKNLAKNAFFESEFEFYDFQKALYNETFQSIVIAHLLVLFLVFLATLNFLITVFSLITLVLCQSSALGICILLGWQIDLLESIGLILSPALSIEIILHLAIQYTNFIESSNESKVLYIF